jgi:adenosylcobinamide amidohydrolase
MHRGENVDNVEVGNENLEKAVILGSFVVDFTSKMDGVLTIRPDDVIVIKVPFDYCDEETTQYLKKMFKTSGFDNKLMILQDSVQIGILRREDSDGSK